VDVAAKLIVVAFCAPPRSGEHHGHIFLQLRKGSCAPEMLELKVGAKVILLKNLDLDAGLVNGSQGTVLRFVDQAPKDGDEPRAADGGGSGGVERYPVVLFRRASDGHAQEKLITREVRWRRAPLLAKDEGERMQARTSPISARATADAV